jgi:hypothetical protein
VDGGVAANNPVHEVWEEATDIWCDDDGQPLDNKLACMVSIGTGISKNSAYSQSPRKMLTSLIEIATETEETAERFDRSKRHLSRQRRYFRFNVPHGLDDVGLSDWERKDQISAATDRYLEYQRVDDDIKWCATRLADDQGTLCAYGLGNCPITPSRLAVLT